MTDGVTPHRSRSGGQSVAPGRDQASWGQCEGRTFKYTFDGYEWDTIDGETAGERSAGTEFSGPPVRSDRTYAVPKRMGGRFRVRWR